MSVSIPKENNIKDRAGKHASFMESKQNQNTNLLSPELEQPIKLKLETVIMQLERTSTIGTKYTQWTRTTRNYAHIIRVGTRTIDWSISEADC